MSTLQIEERIHVSAPPARVWKFILDPARVAACLPGAKLDGTEGERTFLGTMKVKVGPVVMEFKGKATMSEVVAEERRVTLSGTGNDKSGGGSARMDMKSQILPKDGGGSEIVVIADVDLAGKLVRFGRGMMEGISKQLFKQFSERVRAELENEEEEEEEEEEVAPPEGDEPAPTLGSTEAPKPAPSIETTAKEGPAQAPAIAPEDTQSTVFVDKASSERSTPADEAIPPPATTRSETQPAETAPAEAAPAEAAPAEAAPAEAAPAEAAPAPAEAAPAEAAPAGAPTEEPAPAKAAIAEAAPTKAAPEEAVETSPATLASPTAEIPTDSTGRAAPSNTEPSRPKSAITKKKKPPRKAALAPVDNAPLDAGSLVWAAIWSWIRGFFARVFGKKEDQ